GAAALPARVTVALLLIGLASVAALDGYLVGRLDDQLQQVAVASARQGPPRFGGPGPPHRGPPSPYLVQYRLADGRLAGPPDENPLEQDPQPPQVPDDPAWFEANAGEAVTVPATGGDGRWRVAVEPRRDGSGGSVVVAARLD